MPSRPTTKKKFELPKKYQTLDLPLWDGPEKAGVTQSILGRYIADKERARINLIEGLKTIDRFSHRMHYGQMWHKCEEHIHNWQPELLKYTQHLAQKEFPSQGVMVKDWYNICKLQFPIYQEWWKNHPDELSRKVLYPEQVFSVKYKLPSGHTVILRGRWDSIDLIDNSSVFLQENKTKGDIVPELLKRQLKFDLQTMVYIVALQEAVKQGKVKLPKPLKGVRYNVIRRPLSGGLGSIRKHKEKKTKNTYTPEETQEEYNARLGEIIKNAHGTEVSLPQGQHYFFMRWKIEVSLHDIQHFQNTCLDPILENLCNDYEWWSTCKQHKFDPYDWQKRKRIYPDHVNRHFRMPYGIYNPLLEDNASDLDDYLDTGSLAGLQRMERSEELFKELV